MEFKFIKHLFFQTIDPVVKLGSKKSLEAGDLPELPADLHPRNVAFDESLIDWTSEKSILKTMFRSSRKLWLPGFSLMALCGAFNLMSPYLVHEFVGALEQGRATDSRTWVIAVLIGVTGMFSGLAVQHYFYRILRLYQVYTNVLNKKLFGHALRLSKESREKTPIGDIVNHMSSDSDSVANVGSVFGELLYNFVVLIGVAVMMANFLGATSVVAWVLLLALIPLTKKVGADFSRLDERLMKERDERVTLMSQILSAIRVVKFFAWEQSVTKEVEVVRNRELEARKKLAFAELLATMSYVAVSTLVLFVVLFVHSWRGFELSAALIFTCVSLFTLLEDPFSSLSRQISAFANARVGARRIAAFLAKEVRQELPQASSLKATTTTIEFRDWSMTYAGAESATLKNLSFEIGPQELVAVVGPVGSGKSTLMLALLGELRGVGTLKVPALSKAFVSQEAYLVNGTLRENLLLGRSATDARLQLALERSCLIEDMRLWDSGLNTEIGEKGVNLSGGQKQRLSLARADLQEAELYLLDDPLSAVDPSTEAKIVERLILKSWAGKTRVVITHRLEHLSEFDRVLFVKDGGVKGFASHGDLMRTNDEYRDFLQEHEKTQNAEFGNDTKTEDSGAALSGSALQITQEEDREMGAVQGSVYADYLRSLGGKNLAARPWIWLGLALAACASTAFPLMQKSWLGFVSNVQSNVSPLPGIFSAVGVQDWVLKPTHAVLVYGVLGLFTLGGILAADLFWLRRGLGAGRDMHDSMLKSVLGAPVRFFDSTPVGRVLQRFSRDLESIDIQLQWTFEHSMKCFAQILVTLFLILSVLPIVLVGIVPILFVYWRFQKMYRVAAREAKRLDSVSRSPRYVHFKETLQGLVVIRAFDRTEWFMRGFYDLLAHNQRMFYGHYMINRWFSTRIPVVGALVAMSTSLAIVHAVSIGALTPGVAGLLTLYSLNFWGVLNWGVRIWADVEARMTSVERVRFMSELEQEKSTLLPRSPTLQGWPSRGEIEFVNVKARYARDLPQVLKGLNFKIDGQTRVGLIGRTGSGKSTIFQTMFRFLELEEGQILIDGVDIASVPLPKLRTVLAVIPQDPSLFLGTLKTNLDRFNQFEEAEVWRVLERTQLATWIRSLPKGLETEVVENGHNLSQGQRQLMCLARALLLKAKILIMDEATASVDVQTDALIQTLVREECLNMTIVMIAHRLGTVRDCNQVIELADGKVKRILYPQSHLGVKAATHAVAP
ncbi:MAG: ABC transporter transmembrane domain-containing protein [Bdellovibrio sp.]